MRKILIYIFVSIVCLSDLFSQYTVEMESYLGTNLTTWNFDTTYGKGFIVHTTNAFDSLIYLKTDPNGNLIWRKKISHQGYGPTNIYDIKTVPGDSGFILNDHVSVNNGFGSVLRIIRTDSEGNIIWIKNHGPATEGRYAYDILPVSNNGFLALSAFGDDLSMYSPTGLDYGISYLDKDGNAKNEVRYIPDIANDFPEDIKSLPDGSYIIAGNSQYKPLINGSGHPYLLKIRGNGISISSKPVIVKDTLIEEYVYEIVPVPGGGYVFVGDYEEWGPTNRTGYIVKVDDNFNIVWKRYYSIPGELVTVRNIEVLSDSTFLAAVFIFNKREQLLKIDKNGNITDTFNINRCNKNSFREMMLLGDSSLVLGGYCDLFGGQSYLLKLGKVGNPYVWNYCETPPTADFTWTYNGSSVHFIDQSNSNLTYGDIFAHEWDFGNGTSGTAKDPFVVYYGNDEDSIDVNVRLIVTSNLGCKDTISKTVRVKTVRDITGTFQIFPNPYDDFATVRIKTKKISEGGDLILYDLLGRAIRTYTIPSLPNQEFYEFTIDRQNMASEMYIYKLRIGEEVNLGKIIIQ